jgi:hypothetical protein
VAVKIRVCPCGTRLEKKKYESDKAFEKRLHCNGKCRTRYYKPKPAERGFGIETPKDKSKPRVGRGMLNYLYGRPV